MHTRTHANTHTYANTHTHTQTQKHTPRLVDVGIEPSLEFQKLPFGNLALKICYVLLGLVEKLYIGIHKKTQRTVTHIHAHTHVHVHMHAHT